MDIIISILISLLCFLIGAAFGKYIVKKANRNPGQIDGYIVVDHDDGQFNLFSTFERDPAHYFDKQILIMEVKDISTPRSQEKQS